ncbi:MAG TPA: hypothetical protein DCR93_20010 [Cytophagales bacterium]|nr:hypothetical protein [Cytophagales bacterium]HAP61684.1 hypothetical protein [Cytophagales bacterium]
MILGNYKYDYVVWILFSMVLLICESLLSVKSKKFEGIELWCFLAEEPRLFL